MRELRRIHKGELKEANKLASKILQAMDQLERDHDNEKQVCITLTTSLPKPFSLQSTHFVRLL